MNEKQYRTKMFSKISSDGYSGGGNLAPHHGLGRKKDTGLQLMHQSTLAIFFMNDGRIHVAKNRWGDKGDISSEEFLKLSLRMLAQKVYHSNAEIFQEGLVNQLEPMIKDILEKNKVGVKNNDTL